MRTPRTLAAAAIAATLFAGCSSSDHAYPKVDETSGRSAPSETSARPSATGASSPVEESAPAATSGKSASSAQPANTGKLRAFDPPKAFAAEGLVIDAPAAESNMGGQVTTNYTTLSGTRAFVAEPDALTAIDLSTGQQAWSVTVDNPAQAPNTSGMVTGQGPAAPAVSADGATVAAAFLTVIKGSGTTTDQVALTVVGVDIATGKQRWTVSSPTALSTYDAGQSVTRVVGFNDDAVMATASGWSEYNAIWGIADGKVRWTPAMDDYDQPKMTPVSFNDAVAVVLTNDLHDEPAAPTPALVGLSTKDGSTVWTAEKPEEPIWKGTVVVGPSYDAVFTETFNGAKWELALQLFETATGTPTAVLSGIPFNGVGVPQCTYDQQGVSVCVDFETLFAIDGSSGELLWQLPDDKQPGREAPALQSAFHGIAYTRSSNGPVLLDARTGADAVTDVTVAPFTVDEYGGLALDSDGKVAFYPAAG